MCAHQRFVCPMVGALVFYKFITIQNILIADKLKIIDKIFKTIITIQKIKNNLTQIYIGKSIYSSCTSDGECDLNRCVWWVDNIYGQRCAGILQIYYNSNNFDCIQIKNY